MSNSITISSKKTINLPHVPVLLAEVIDYLDVKDGGKYLDCTFGAGGYSRAILKAANCQVIGLDQDPITQSYANDLKKIYPDYFNFYQTNFILAAKNLTGQQFDGIVLDLGVSSMQLEEGSRGFSFLLDGPLDMRMDNTKGISAADFIATATTEEIANVIFSYGGETKSRKIAKAITDARQIKPIETSLQLASIVRKCFKGYKGKIDSATKTFQAIRIHVNQELSALEEFLADVSSLLKQNGRFVVVSFHSLEDAIVKKFFKENSAKKIAKSKYSPKLDLFQQESISNQKWLKIITSKPIVPTVEEVKNNPRSRSAKLRCAQKLLQGGQ